MNITTSLGLAAAGLLTTVLAGAPAAQAASPEWKTERGIVLECQGEAHGLRVWTSVYENQRYGNVVQVVIGDPDDGNGSSKNTDETSLCPFCTARTSWILSLVMDWQALSSA